MSAPFCTYPFCSNRTRHATVRCRHHLPNPNPRLVSSKGFGATEWLGVDNAVDLYGGPARVVRERGVVIEENFYVAGFRHRLDGPAITYYRFDGSIRREEWRIDGAAHRLDGPMSTNYAPDGSVVSTIYALDDIGYLSASSFVEQLRSWSVKRLRRELGRSSFAPLLDEGITPAVVLGAIAGDVWSLEGIREIAAGAPVEWVRSFESGQTAFASI